MPLGGGQTFAGYRIVRLLGSGGMGEVYLAEHPRLPRHNALKVLPEAVSADPDYRARFAREADLASRLWHPHVVGVHDRGEHDGQLWISMDYVDGLDAAELLGRRFTNGMPREQVVSIVTAVAGALDYAHKQGLLHRDVKPANIMLTHADEETLEQRVLLTDFGIARDIGGISGITATNMTMGTVAYAAPEQLMGEDLDGRADQYALAATAFHLLTGTQLFPQSNPAVVISRHLNAAPPSISESKPQLSDLDPVFQTALAKDPRDRFPRCADFARALTDHTLFPSPPTGLLRTVQAESSGSVTAPTHSEPPTTTRGSAPRRSPRRWLITTALVIAVALAGATMLLWHPWRERQTIANPPSSQSVSTPSPPSAISPPSIPTTTDSPTPAALPDDLPTNSGCRGTVVTHHDIKHKAFGKVRIFLTLAPGRGFKDGCIGAVSASGKVLPAIHLDVEEHFGFPSPASDSTGNTFVTYNPGRYDGVLVLIPNADGFKEIGWDPQMGDTHYMGRYAYYNAELAGPGENGEYTIRKSQNDCTPSCAEGTTTTQDLHWDGTDYVP